MSDLDIKRFVFRKGAANHIPVSGTFELTARCNFRCKMCYVQMTPEEQKKVGRELTTQEWLHIAQQAVDAGMIYLLLTGGEPLLRPDFAELYTSLVKMGIVVSVNTNGSLITPEIAECFRRFPPERVNITLYGASPCRYASVCGNEAAYEKTIRGIQMLKQAGVRIDLNTTFIGENREDMAALVAFAQKEDIPIRTAAYLFPPVRNGHEEQLGNLTAEETGRLCAEFDYLTMDEAQRQNRLKQIETCLSGTSTIAAPEPGEVPCMAGRGSFWISWDGMLYSCGMLPHEGAWVQKLGFEEAWHRITESAKSLRIPGECLVCKFRKLCPTCPAISQCVNQEQGKLVQDLCIRTQAYAKTFTELVQQKLLQCNISALELGN